MGISYVPQKVYGVYIHGDEENLLSFLRENGYKISKKENEKLKEDGDYSEDLMWHLGLSQKWIDCYNVNSWSGADYVVGISVENIEDIKKGKYHERFLEHFSKTSNEPQLIEFVQLL